jgi:O-antigen ligase
MPEHIRALVVILFLATIIFVFARKTLAPLLPPKVFKRWCIAWFGITLIAFLSHNFWIFIIGGALFLIFVSKKLQNRFALFLVLLLAVPNIAADISGLGIINYLMSVDYVRLLSLTILLPAYLAMRGKAGTISFGKTWPDRILLAYLLLDLALRMRDTTFSDTLRWTLYNFTDIFLPYYVASRGIKSLEQLKEAVIAFLIAGLIVGLIGIFEHLKYWLLYASLPYALDVNWDMASYLSRSDNLRAIASAGHSIVLGYIVMLALGMYLIVATSINNKLWRWAGAVLILGALYAPLSRGPWVGAVALVFIWLALGPQAVKRVTMMIFAGLVALPLLTVLPGGDKIINLLPFVGKVESENIDYRKKLIDNATLVIERSPWFGSVNYLNEPEMRDMVQGQGIIDIVNTYIAIALQRGLVGLGLFIGFFASVLLVLLKTLRRIPDRRSELHLYGRTLFASLSAVLVTILTVSSIIVIPIIYWSMAGLAVAYIFVARKILAEQSSALPHG